MSPRTGSGSSGWIAGAADAVYREATERDLRSEGATVKKRVLVANRLYAAEQPTVSWSGLYASHQSRARIRGNAAERRLGKVRHALSAMLRGR